MRKRLPKVSTAKICAALRSRRTIQWACKCFTECVPLDRTIHVRDQRVSSLPARAWHDLCETPAKLKMAIPEVLENAGANLTTSVRNLVCLLWSEWKEIELQIVIHQRGGGTDCFVRSRLSAAAADPCIGPLIASPSLRRSATRSFS